jgi:hypothetical protein
MKHIQAWLPREEAANTMRAPLEKLLQSFVHIRTTTPYRTQPDLWNIMDSLKSSIEAIPAYETRPYLRCSWSLGQGNWALVPWVAILDERVTFSREQGIYCVLLFREDMSGVYLCLGQGTTALANDLPRSEVYSELNRRAEMLRSKISDLAACGFNVGPGIDLHATRTLGKSYEQAAVAFKLYETGKIPDDEAIIKDITVLLDAYDRVVEAQAIEESYSEDESTPPSPRVWVYAPGDRTSFWDELYEDGLMAIGWDELGTLLKYPTLENHLDAHREAYKKNAESRNNARTTYDFVYGVRPGDKVFARRGLHRIVGYGTVTGDYKFLETRTVMKNTRRIMWLGSGEWQSPIRFPIKTLTAITSRTDDIKTLLELVGWIDESKPTPRPLEEEKSSL